jgi:salicylate hydroxylase
MNSTPPGQPAARPGVLIAGGGIGGLAAALALARRGIASQILERRPALGEDGAGIQIGPNGVKILRALGVADGLSARVGVPQSILVRDAARGATLAELPLGPWMDHRHGAPYWVAHRADLHAAMLAAARAHHLIAIETGFAIASASQSADAVHVTSAEGRVVTGSALIGADGLWSTIRTEHFDAKPPVPRQLAAARAVVPAAAFSDPMAATNTCVWLAPGSHVVHYPVRSGTEIAIVVIYPSELSSSDWSAGMTQPAFAQLALDLHASIAATLRSVEAWRCWPLLTRAPLRTWAEGRIALLGDAAQPILPFLAQGAVMALEDAVTLADALAVPGAEVPDALRNYADQRMPRRQRVSATAARNGVIYHMRGPAAYARNLVMAARSGPSIMAGYDWLYGFNAL